VEVKVILIWKYVKAVGWKGMDWIYLAQDRDRWWELLKMKIKLWVP